MDETLRGTQKTVEVEKDLSTLPATLALHVKRVKPDYVQRRFVKNNEGVLFPERFDLSKYLSEDFVANRRGILVSDGALIRHVASVEAERERIEETLETRVRWSFCSLGCHLTAKSAENF
jgi:hypothetical protein